MSPSSRAACAFTLLAYAGPALAKDGFTGTWTADLKTQDATQTVDDYLVRDGVYASRRR